MKFSHIIIKYCKNFSGIFFRILSKISIQLLICDSLSIRCNEVVRAFYIKSLAISVRGISNVPMNVQKQYFHEVVLKHIV